MLRNSVSKIARTFSTHVDNSQAASLAACVKPRLDVVNPIKTEADRVNACIQTRQAMLSAESRADKVTGESTVRGGTAEEKGRITTTQVSVGRTA